MDHARQARRVAAATLAAAGIAAAAACGTADGGGDRPGGGAAERLATAQLVQFGDAKVVPERSEEGPYGELATVRNAEELRSATELDKPDCLDAVNRWARLPGVRDAAASLATFARGEDTIAHLLVDAGADVAEEAVAASPPAECATYTATLQDGSTSTYRVRELELDRVGDASRGFAVETEMSGERVLLYSLLYRNADYLATTTILGTGDADEYADTLTAFSRAALDRESEILPS
jgi:hypothetical protein